jgi:hypothetical protein
MAIYREADKKMQIFMGHSADKMADYASQNAKIFQK